MASPLGHAVVGAATAAVVARATGTPLSPVVWSGSIVASGLPDLDLMLTWFGRAGPRYHRNGSHSMIVLVAIIVAAFLLSISIVPNMPTGTLLCWSAALLTHPILDVLTTGPGLAARGYGIGLFWPISRRRFFVQRPVVNTPNLERCRTIRGLMVSVWPEMRALGPPALLVLFLATVL